VAGWDQHRLAGPVPRLRNRLTYHLPDAVRALDPLHVVRLGLATDALYGIRRVLPP
jgi:hypothetical protein